MSAEPEPGAHPGTDTLGDLAAGLPADAGAAEHVAGCPQCQEQLGRIETVRARLGALPPVPLPPDVAARVDRTLAAGGRPPRRTRPRPSFAPLAAVAALVLLVGGVVAGALHLGAGGHSSAGTSNAIASSPPPVPLRTLSSGENFTPDTLAAAVPSLLQQAALPAGMSGVGGQNAAAAGGSTSSASLVAPASPSPAPSGPDPLAALRDSTALLNSCVTALTEQPTRVARPLAIDFARFRGEPAVVVVVPTPHSSATVDVWVAGPLCGRVPGGDFRYFRRVPRTG